jgi:hypothetical protein
MKRDELEHVLRAAGAITGVSTWVIVGSQAILGAEKSPFHESFGYYGYGVGPETTILPSRWRVAARLCSLGV